MTVVDKTHRTLNPKLQNKNHLQKRQKYQALYSDTIFTNEVGFKKSPSPTFVRYILTVSKCFGVGAGADPLRKYIVLKVRVLIDIAVCRCCEEVIN